MIILIEAMALCLIFTLIIVPMVLRNPLSQIYNYPPAIIQRVKNLGLITEECLPGSKTVIRKKVIASIILGSILAVFLKAFNREETFLEAFLIGYLLWTIVDWYDAFILDCIWFCHCKKIIIKGTEDMESEYHNYAYHIKRSCKGMFLGVPVCVLAAVIVILL